MHVWRAMGAAGFALASRVQAAQPGTADHPGAEPDRSSRQERPSRVVRAGPTDYLSRLRTLLPGDTLELAAGVYDVPGQVPGLPIFDLHGEPDRPITIRGPGFGRRAVLLGRSTHATIRFARARHVVIRGIEVDGRDAGGPGVAVQGPADHITLEGLTIQGVGGHQQVVGISTVGHATAHWVIRGNVIIGAGTGMYLGNSDGTNPFVAGLIEHNLIRDTIGYNLQIKHQRERPPWPALPDGPSVTVIRHNVFNKSANSSTGAMARPNLLVGHFPLGGVGADDHYEVYGNLFWQNPTESLFQGEGNVALYANLMVNDHGRAVAIQPHNDVPRMVRVFGNTVVSRGSGITITGGAAAHRQQVMANAVFADVGIGGGEEVDNFVVPYDTAADHLIAASRQLPGFRAWPGSTAMRGTAFDPSGVTRFTDFDRDFDGLRRDWTWRGAVASPDGERRWEPRLAVKPIVRG